MSPQCSIRLAPQHRLGRDNLKMGHTTCYRGWPRKNNPFSHPYVTKQPPPLHPQREMLCVPPPFQWGMDDGDAPCCRGLEEVGQSCRRLQTVVSRPPVSSASWPHFGPWGGSQETSRDEWSRVSRHTTKALLHTFLMQHIKIID